MTSLRDAAQQALEALEDYQYAEARDALRAALAEPENWELRRLHADPHLSAAAYRRDQSCRLQRTAG